jgi:hypothetical protein
MGCGKPFNAGAQSPQAISWRWEYKDIVIQFPRERFTNIRSDDPRRYDEVVQLADSIILASLQQEGHYGWQAEGPTDFRTLERLNFVQRQTREIFAFSRVAVTTTSYEYATIRLKRLIP